MSDREQEIEHLERLRARHKANIRKLEKMLAGYGPLESPLNLLNKLELEQEQLRQVEEELAALRGEGPAEVAAEQAVPVWFEGPQVVASGDRAAAVGGDVHGDVVTGEKVDVGKAAEVSGGPPETEALEPPAVTPGPQAQPVPSQAESARRGINWEQVGAIAGAIGLLIALAAWLIPNAGSYLFGTPAATATPATLPATFTPAATSPPTVALTSDVKLDFWFEVKASDANEFVPGVEGGKYRSGETLRFHFTPTTNGYAYLFSLDTAGKFTPLWPDYTSREAGQVEAGEDYQTIEFELDDREGWEQFFAVASTQPFSYDEDVEPHLHPKPLPGGRGVEPVLKLLELREDRFFHEKITFAHVK